VKSKSGPSESPQLFWNDPRNAENCVFRRDEKGGNLWIPRIELNYPQ
jgi:hypothetical protein